MNTANYVITVAVERDWDDVAVEIVVGIGVGRVGDGRVLCLQLGVAEVVLVEEADRLVVALVRDVGAEPEVVGLPVVVEVALGKT